MPTNAQVIREGTQLCISIRDQTDIKDVYYVTAFEDFDLDLLVDEYLGPVKDNKEFDEMEFVGFLKSSGLVSEVKPYWLHLERTSTGNRIMRLYRLAG